ncbi:MAG: type II secretion system F family protein [Desulfocucumaceae bacterium]
MLESLIDLVRGTNAPVAAGALVASSVLVAAAGNRLKLPGGVELRGRADEILQKTGKKMGNDISRTVLQKKITQADLDIQPEYFAGLQFALPIITVAVFLPPSLLGWIDIFWAALLAVILYLAPGVWLNKKVKARVESIKKDIPDFCMLLGNALGGADLLTAMEEVARTLKGELAREINRALMDMATGDSRAAALNKMALRCGIPELSGLVNKILQAMRYGSPLEPVVKHHAEKILARRKQETQKVAGELTIKLLFPIIVFVLLPLFILLGFPVLWNIWQIFGSN